MEQKILNEALAITTMYPNISNYIPLYQLETLNSPFLSNFQVPFYLAFLFFIFF